MHFRCYYCHHVKAENVEDIIDHSITTHPEKSISILQSYLVNGRTKYKSLHYNLMPSAYIDQKMKIDVNVVIRIQDKDDENSPMKKGANFQHHRKVLV
jgi:hypothetical protein